MIRILFSALVLSACAAPVLAQSNYTRTEDVIYGRKHGLSMTMDIFTPKAAKNGAAVIFAVSGGWFSSKEAIGLAPVMLKPLLDRGYTIFAVVHGSQPKFQIPDAIEDMNRATRFIRAKAKDYQIDPDRIGVTGGSAGGHLSLMLGNHPLPPKPKDADPIEQTSSKVNAVACFFPPTDFLNWSAKGNVAMPGNGKLGPFKAPFDFHEFDKKSRSFELVTDQEKRKEIFREISPIYHVSKESAPALIIHGDKDELVPIYQAEIIVNKYKEVGVPADLIVKKGAPHGWVDMHRDTEKFADWFDKYMPKK